MLLMIRIVTDCVSYGVKTGGKSFIKFQIWLTHRAHPYAKSAVPKSKHRWIVNISAGNQVSIWW